MKIDTNKNYHVELYTENDYKNYGCNSGKDVKDMLKGCRYDAELEMWFTPKGRKGYFVTEVE